MSAGSFGGPEMPTQNVASTSGSPASVVDGVSGSAGQRSRPATASTRSLPALNGAATALHVPTPMRTWPPAVSVTASEPPLRAMARVLPTSAPTATANWRNAMSCPPTPPSEVQVKFAVSLFRASPASFSVLKGESG